MAFGPFRQMVDGSICLANQTAIVGTTETALFPVANFSGFAANQLRSGQVWHLTSFGIITTAGASPGNITITPRFGTSTSGTSLGASEARALATSGSNLAWRLEYDFIVRRAEGANATCVGNGWAGFATGVLSSGTNMYFGSTASVTIDVTAAAGIFIGITLGSASDSMTAMGVMLESVN